MRTRVLISLVLWAFALAPAEAWAVGHQGSSVPTSSTMANPLRERIKTIIRSNKRHLVYTRAAKIFSQGALQITNEVERDTNPESYAIVKETHNLGSEFHTNRDVYIFRNEWHNEEHSDDIGTELLRLTGELRGLKYRSDNDHIREGVETASWHIMQAIVSHMDADLFHSRAYLAADDVHKSTVDGKTSVDQASLDSMKGAAEEAVKHSEKAEHHLIEVHKILTGLLDQESVAGALAEAPVVNLKGLDVRTSSTTANPLRARIAAALLLHKLYRLGAIAYKSFSQDAQVMTNEVADDPNLENHWEAEWIHKTGEHSGHFPWKLIRVLGSALHEIKTEAGGKRFSARAGTEFQNKVNEFQSKVNAALDFVTQADDSIEAARGSHGTAKELLWPSGSSMTKLEPEATKSFAEQAVKHSQEVESYLFEAEKILEGLLNHDLVAGFQGKRAPKNK